jgi:hypothetical protein
VIPKVSKNKKHLSYHPFFVYDKFWSFQISTKEALSTAYLIFRSLYFFIKILIPVLMGRGLVDWILVDHEKLREFHAVPHAVESLKTMDIPRSIFAVMKSPPLEAFPGIDGGNKFIDVFFNHDISHANVHSESKFSTPALKKNPPKIGHHNHIIFSVF